MTRGRYERTDHEFSIISPPPPNKPRDVPRVGDARVLNGILGSFEPAHPERKLLNATGCKAPATTASRVAKGRRLGSSSWSRFRGL